MDDDAMWKPMPQTLGTTGSVLTPANANATQLNALTTALGTSMKEFVCPSYGGQLYNQSTLGNSGGSPTQAQQAITNYKAMGASCKQSLAFAANSSGTAPYGTSTVHPDGAIYPSAANISASQCLDGLSHTVFFIESIDSTASCWVLGSECVLTGNPGSGSNSQSTPNSVPTGTTPKSPYNYFSPASYDNTWGDTSGVSAAGERTFMMYDCSPSGADAGAYANDGDPGSTWTTTDQGSNYPQYGPSSSHPAVCVVGLGDASTQQLSKRTDAANFFFLITKANSDPFNIP
jgi:hypothetical protein